MRVYRVYCELELNLRIKPRQRLESKTPVSLWGPEKMNQMSFVDFMLGQLTDGRRIPLLNVINDFNRESLGIEVDFSFSSERVTRTPDYNIVSRGKPESIRCDDELRHI